MKRILLFLFLPFSFFGVHAQGINLVYDFEPGASSGGPTRITLYQNQLFMSVFQSAYGRELVRYDGVNTPALVADINPGTASGFSFSLEEQMQLIDNKLFFAANDGNGFEMFVYDGTNPPSVVSEVTPGSADPEISNLVQLNGKLYFAASDATHGLEIWRTDPLNMTSQRVTDLAFGSASGVVPLGQKVLCAFQNKIYFNGSNGTIIGELFAYDPSTNSTELVADISATTSSYPINLTVIDGKMYFTASTAGFGRELYVYTGSGSPQRLTDMNPGPADGVAGPPFLYKGNIYFAGNASVSGGTSGFELCRFNPLSGTAEIVADINPGVLSSRLGSFYSVYADRLYFEADDGIHGRELWQYDGITSPVMVTDLNPNSLDSNPSLPVIMGDNLYFRARRDDVGNELFRFRASDLSIQDAFSSADISVFPNPAVQDFSVRLKESNESAWNIRLYSMSGTLVMTCEAQGNSFEISLPVSHLSAGTYLLEVKGERTFYSQKVNISR